MKPFFDVVRAKFGKLSADQVEGFNVLLGAINGLPIPHQAYVLATSWHETARTMQPIREYGRGKGRKYGAVDQTGKAPYGRGYVQLTWRENYVRADRELGLKGRLAADYDVAMEPEIAAKIIVRGMVEGWFNGQGKGLRHFKTYREMRRTVNILDKADMIAGYAETFEKALRAIPEREQQPPQTAPEPQPLPGGDNDTPPVAVNPEPTVKAPEASETGLLDAIVAALRAIIDMITRRKQ